MISKISSHLIFFAVDQSQIELFSQKSSHKDIVDEKILGILETKTLAGKVKKQMWRHLGSVDNLEGSGNVENVEDAVAIVGVELHIRANFIFSYFPVHKLISLVLTLKLMIRERCLV